MAFEVGISLITGVMLGIEFTSGEDGTGTYAVLDLLIVRVVLGFHSVN